MRKRNINILNDLHANMNRNHIHKTLIAVSFLLMVVFSSCGKDIPAGTLEDIDRGNSKNIEVYRYYYDKNAYVLIARFRDSPQLQTTIYDDYSGKNYVTKSSTIISAKDTIVFIDSHDEY